MFNPGNAFIGCGVRRSASPCRAAGRRRGDGRKVGFRTPHSLLFTVPGSRVAVDGKAVGRGRNCGWGVGKTKRVSYSTPFHSLGCSWAVCLVVCRPRGGRWGVRLRPRDYLSSSDRLAYTVFVRNRHGSRCLLPSRDELQFGQLLSDQFYERVFRRC